jgi:hypothetical protein
MGALSRLQQSGPERPCDRGPCHRAGGDLSDHWRNGCRVHRFRFVDIQRCVRKREDLANLSYPDEPSEACCEISAVYE